MNSIDLIYKLLSDEEEMLMSDVHLYGMIFLV